MGEYKDDTVRYPNGDEFVGAFVNGMKHGYGGMRYATTGDVYEGQWANNRKHGIGKTIYPDGTTWEGEYRDGVKWAGKGTIKYKSGDVCCEVSAFYEL